MIPSRLRRLLLTPGAALLTLSLVAYAYFYQAGGWNQNSRFDLTRALVERGTVRIDAYERNTGDESRRAGHMYSDKAPGVSLAAVPAWAAVRAVSPEPPTPGQLAVGAWLGTVVAVGVPAALAVLALLRLARAWGARAGAAVLLAGSYALATLAWPYATLMYGHQVIAALMVIAFAALAGPHARGEEVSLRRLVGVGVLLGWAVVVEYPAALAVVVLGAYALTCAPPRRVLLGLALGGAAPALVLATYHAVAFGGPLALPYEFSTQPHRHQGFFMGLGVPSPDVLGQILVSRYRGLLYAAPWLALGVVGLVPLWRRGRRAEAGVCASLVLLFLWLNASLVDWQGGWAMGPRYLVPMVPFLVLPIAALLPRDGDGAAWPARLPRWAALTAVVAAAALVARSAALMLVGTAVKPEVPTHIRQPFADYLLPRFWRGDLAVSTQSIDMAGHPEHGPAQAWNLGHALGLHGHATLAPLVLVLLACAAWAWWAVRATGAERAEHTRDHSTPA
jgi:hypothetical protein